MAMSEMKRKTKKDREMAQRNKLYDRCLDLLRGAGGGYTDVENYLSTPPDERGSMIAELGSEIFGRWLGAVAQHLTFVSEGQQAMIVKPAFLEKYDDFDKAIDWLYELGVRA